MKGFRNISIFSILLLTGLLLNNTLCQEWQSKIVYYKGDKLVYERDEEGNRIPEFSWAGYKNGKEIPYVDVVKTIEPVSGDNTEHIQKALDEMAGMPLNSNGFRGALLLKVGKYRVSGTLYVRESGIILRGEGSDEDSTKNTIIYGTGDSPHQRSIIIAGGGAITKWIDKVENTTSMIISDKILVGENKFRVDNPSIYNVGDNIIIVHPASDTWLDSIDRGGTFTDPGWKITDGINIVYNRYITDIKDDTIFVDVPFFYNFDRNLTQPYIYKYARQGLKTNIGIENLRVDIEAVGVPTDKFGNEDHAWHGIELMLVEDSWVKGCTISHFGQSAVRTSTATRVTIENCKAIDPISKITGERRYNFNMYHASQQILVKNCYTRYGRHDYMSNGTSTVSGCVFYNNVSEFTYNSSEGHRWWSQGLLYDNITYKSSNYSYVLALYNRGNKGTSHGWAAVNSVAWNIKVEDTKNIYIQKPPTAQNYAIGCFAGYVTGEKSKGTPFLQPEGYIEGTNQPGLKPASLYEAQFNIRNNITSVNKKEKVLPKEFRLNQNYPNPFNPSTRINFTLKKRSHVKLEVFNSLGQKITTLVDDYKESGIYDVNFNASKYQLSSGVYFCRLKTENYSETISMMLIK